MKSRFLVSAASALILATPAFAEAPKWGAHLDFEGRWSNARTLGDAGLFAPLWQSRDTLLFTDIRGKFDSQDGREGNFGLGIRHMLDSGWNLGAYGYVDARRTPLGSHFNQVTLGVEALSADYDLRLNVYAPFGNTSRQIGDTVGGNPFAEFANGTIQIVTPGRTQIIERAMSGVDGEFGWRAPVFDVEALTQVRLYGGGFYFSGNGVTPDIAGPRGRVEFSVDDLLGFSHARLTLGAEVQHDDVRGTQGFAVARLRVPLQQETKAPRLTAQERRMTERVVRDVDIVSGTGRGGQSRGEVREAAINTWNNQVVTSTTQVSPADQAALQAALTAQAAGSVVILNGAVTGVTTSMTVGVGQTLIGGGTALALRGATTGTAINFIAPGAAGTIGGEATGGLIVVASQSVVGGLTIDHTGMATIAINGNNADGARVFGSTITSTGPGATGVRFDASSGVTISGNQIVQATHGGLGIVITGGERNAATGNTVTLTGNSMYGFWIVGSPDVVVSDNAVAATGTGNHGMWNSNSARGTITGNSFAMSGGSGGGVILANAVDTTFSGNTVSTAGSSAHGVKLDGGTNFVLADNVITTSGDNSNAANIWGATVTIAGNRLSTAGLISNALDTSSSTVQITNNTVAAEQGTGVRMVSTTVLAGSTGNMSDMNQAQRCFANGSPGVSDLQFEDGVACVSTP